MIEYRYVTGRSRKSSRLKWNPVWWFKNDDEQHLSDAPWYLPNKPQAERELLWELRNPLQNFRNYVLGVGDCNYKVVGRAPVMTVQRDDLTPPETGWQWCLLYGGDLKWPRPFISYSGKIVFQLGWQPSGFFGLRFNIHKG